MLALDKIRRMPVVHQTKVTLVRGKAFAMGLYGLEATFPQCRKRQHAAYKGGQCLSWSASYHARPGGGLRVGR